MSKWEKLLQGILGLSRDMRFDELRKVLESYGFRCMRPMAEAVILPSASLDASPSPSPGMSLSSASTSKWCEM